LTLKIVGTLLLLLIIIVGIIFYKLRDVEEKEGKRGEKKV
jgi:hypothetical protein